MLKNFWHLMREYWPVSVVLATVLVAWMLWLMKFNIIADVVLTVVTAGFALFPLIATWRDLQSGINRINILSSITLITSLITRHFWIAIALVTVTYLSKYVTRMAYRRSRRSVERRKRTMPTVVSVMRGRKVLEVATEEVHVGDKILCQPDEIVAFDCQVISGETMCDESLLGTDSTSVNKQPDDIILSGSRNLTQLVILKVQHVASDSYYQTTTRLLEKSVGDQTAFVQTSDRYSLYITVTALLIAAAAWYLGHDADRLLVVLVVATTTTVLIPPRLSLKAAIIAASRQGIVFRSGAAIQKLVEANTFVFGFSGIITEDRPTVQAVTASKPFTKNEVLGLAASLEQASDHPVARAVVAAAEAQGFNFIKAKHVQVLPGLGLRANLQGREILVGNARLMTEHGIPLSMKINARLLPLYVATAGQVAGTISLQVGTRKSVQAALAALRKNGVKQIHVLSSLPQAVVTASTTTLEPISIHANANLPDKLTALSAVQSPVVYVGTSADDSLLAAADIGIALGDNSLQANRGPGITIVHQDIAYVALAHIIVRRAVRQAKQTILIGTVASLGLMLLALAGWLPLLLGVGLQLIINCFAALYPMFVSSQKT